MKKRTIAFLLIIVLILSVVPYNVFAANTVSSNSSTCARDWTIKQTNTMACSKYTIETNGMYTITWKDISGKILAVTTHAYGDIITADMAPFVEVEEPELDEVAFWYPEGAVGNSGIRFPYKVTHNECLVAAIGGKTFNATVIYGNGQENGTVAYTTYTPVFEISPKLPVPEYPGHTFLGWEFKDAITGEIIQGMPRTANLVITAKWEAAIQQDITITWWLDNSYQNSVVQTYAYGTVITADMAPAVSPENDGMDPELFEFKGWWRSGMMGQQIIFPYTVTSSQEFVPGFGGKQFTATIIYGNGQENGQYTYSCGMPTFILDMELPVPEYENHTFIGWECTDGVTGQVIGGVVLTANLVITAKWICNHESHFKIEEMNVVPENLASAYESVEEIEEVMTSGTVEAYKEVLEEMGVAGEDVVSILQEVTLAYQDAGGNWVEADEEHFPDDGKLVVELPVPTGTNRKNYTFYVSHMFTTDAFGKTVGEIEYPEVETFTRDGHDYIRFTVTGLSPITISYVPNSTHMVELGDADGDGKIDAADACCVIMYYSEMWDLAEEQLWAADVNGDGRVDTADAYYILLFHNNMIDAFPIGN